MIINTQSNYPYNFVYIYITKDLKTVPLSNYNDLPKNALNHLYLDKVYFFGVKNVHVI